VFKDPDPNKLWVGEQRLKRYLADAGFGWVLALREFMRQREWTEFEKAYPGSGRPAYHPCLMLSLVLFGVLEGRSSLRELEVAARTDVRVWWLTGGAMPDHSVIGRFLHRHRERITTAFFEDCTRALLKVIGSRSATIGVDGTTIQAASSRLRTIKQEAAREVAEQRAAEAAADPENECAAARAELAQEVVETAEKRSEARRRKGRKNTNAPVSPHEPEAGVNKMKNGQVAPSYQASIAANEDRMIIGQHVDGTSESAAVEPMVQQAQRVTGGQIETLLADSNYNNATAHEVAHKHDLELLSPEGSTRNGGRRKTRRFDKSEFSYDSDRDVYVCPSGRELVRKRRSKDWEDRRYTLYRSNDCRGCELREKCLAGKGNRSVARYDHDDATDALREKMKDPEVYARYKRRSVMPEPVFGELRGCQGYVRYRRRRLDGVRLEHALHCAAHNLRRAIRIKLPWTRHASAGWLPTRAVAKRHDRENRRYAAVSARFRQFRT